MFAAIRGYHRRRGWLAWHTAWLGRLEDFPPLHELTGHGAPPEETDEERAARHYRNSIAWVIVTGGAESADRPADEEPA